VQSWIATRPSKPLSLFLRVIVLPPKKIRPGQADLLLIGPSLPSS
jgi:hypothetical protein